MVQIDVFWLKSIILPLAPAFLTSILFIFKLFKTGSRKKSYFYLIFLISMLLMSWFTKIHSGAWINAQIPCYSAIAIFYGMGLSSISEITINYNKLKVVTIIYIIFIFLFVILYYNPLSYIPTNQAKSNGDKLVTSVSGMKGNVYIVASPYLARLSGKRPYTQFFGLYDILRTGDDKSVQLDSKIRADLKNHEFDAIIINKTSGLPGLEDYY